MTSFLYMTHLPSIPTSFHPPFFFLFRGGLRQIFVFVIQTQKVFVTFNTGFPLREWPPIFKMKRLANILAVSHSATILVFLSPCVILLPASHFSILSCFYFTFSTIPSARFVFFLVPFWYSSHVFLPCVLSVGVVL